MHSRNAYGCNALQWAAQVADDDAGMCAWLRDRGLDMRVLNSNGHSALHKAAVKGDTVGDPFKDTAGPSLHVLIKLLATVSLVLGPVFISSARPEFAAD